MSNRSVFKSPDGERAIMATYDELLSRWPVPYGALRVPTRHGETFVITAGDPALPPLVLLHAASANSASWGNDFGRLCRTFRLHAVDLPGEPGKSAANRLSLFGPGYAEWLEDVLDGLGLPRVLLLGYSQGGWTALRFATHRPERVAKLVLIAPGGLAPPRPTLLLKILPLALLGRRGREGIKRVIFGAQRLPRDLDDSMNVIMEGFVPRMGKEYLFSDEELARLTMPVLLMTGSADAVRNSPRMVARMLRLVPHATCRDYPGMGHLLLDFADDVVPFLGDPGDPAREDSSAGGAAARRT